MSSHFYHGITVFKGRSTPDTNVNGEEHLCYHQGQSGVKEQKELHWDFAASQSFTNVVPDFAMSQRETTEVIRGVFVYTRPIN